MAFIPDGESQGLTATWLLHTAEEVGLDIQAIKVARGGFDVPDALVPFLEGKVPAPPDLPPVTKTPPAWWGEPEPEPEVDFAADGKVYLKAPSTGVEPVSAESDSAVVPLDQPGDSSLTAQSQTEVIRAWARQNGYEVADRGLLKKTVREAYLAAQE